MQLTVRQQEIIDAALALIAEQGIQNLTIKNIAAALKITEPAIYRHFDSKFAILDALLDSFDHGSVSVLRIPRRISVLRWSVSRLSCWTVTGE